MGTQRDHHDASTAISDDEEDDGAAASSSFISSNAGMKPKFDAMLKEIEQKLPSLDDEDSDFEVSFTPV